jgi:hypothetical protein
MKSNFTKHFVEASILVALTMLSASAANKPLTQLKFTNPRNITNPYLPLVSLKQDILEGREGPATVRIERTSKPDVHKTFSIGEQKVDALAVEDREFKNGQLAEVALDYFAQADDGTVLYLGEDVDEYRGGKVVGHSGSWLFGKDTKNPGLIMPAQPRVGAKFKSEDVNSEIHEDDEVISASESVTVPAGKYRNCVKVKETLAEGDVEYKYYAFGIGCVREDDVVLKSHQTLLSKEQIQQESKALAAAQPGKSKKKIFQDPLAREALALVGVDPEAEKYWYDAVHDESLPKSERQDLIDDLNETGLPDPKHPTADDLPVISNRLEALEAIAPTLPPGIDWQECRDDLLNLIEVANGGGKPVQ